MKKQFLILSILSLFFFVPLSFAKAETQFYKSDGFVDGFQTPATAQSFCEGLDYGGYDNWHLANETELADLPVGPNSTGYYIDALPRTNCEPVAETMGWFNEFGGVRYLYTINSQLEGGCPMMEEDARNVLCARTVATENSLDFSAISGSMTNSISSTTSNVWDLVSSNLYIILSLLAMIIGLPFIVRLFKRFSK